MKKRTGFVFYESMYKVLMALSPTEAQRFLGQICAYALYGEEPYEFESEVIGAFWTCIHPTLKKERVGFENRKKDD